MQTKIDIAQSILTALKKKSSDGMLYAPGAAGSTMGKEGKKGAGKPVDFTALLITLRDQIKDIHLKNIGHGELDSKTTL